MVKILAKSKSRNLLKFKFRKIFTFKKFQNTSAIEESNFLITNTRIIFTELT